MSLLPIAQGNDIYVTQEGRIANGSMPSAFHFEQLITKYKNAYRDQPSMKDQELIGHKVLKDFYSLDPPGRIWLESQETANVFDQVTDERRAAHICRIFLILTWHPLICCDGIEEKDEGTTGEKQRHPRTRGGMHPVMGSITVDFFATFSRLHNRASHPRNNQNVESEHDE